MSLFCRAASKRPTTCAGCVSVGLSLRSANMRVNSGLIVGICGGFQMLGNEIADPHGLERVGIRTGAQLASGENHHGARVRSPFRRAG